MKNIEERNFKLVDAIINILEENKAENIANIDLNGKSEIADFMVIASGRSSKHIDSLADKIIAELKEYDITGLKAEGEKNSGWLVVDTGDVIVHLFDNEKRDTYKLEELWNKKIVK